MGLMAFLRRQSKATVAFVSVIAFGMVAFIDYMSGTEISFSVFYLIPVGLLAWFCAIWTGFRPSARF